MSSASAPADQAAAEERTAVLASFGCYLFWGLFPLLFKAAVWAGAAAWEMVAWRSVWALIATGVLILATGRAASTLKALSSPRTAGWLVLSALTIGTNWSLFVLAVKGGHTLDASLGYYLNPLLSVAAGMVLFRERIGTAGWIAIVLATIGVVVVTIAYGRLPLLALGMAVSFCLYGIIRKRLAVDALTGLFGECLVLFGPGLAYGLWLQAQGAGHAAQPLAGLLMALMGPATVAPLATFAWAARRMPLSTMGFIQFISPTMQFFVALAFGEALKPLGILAFAFIWAGVAVYAVTAWRKTRGLAARQRGQVSGDAARTSPAK